MSSVTSTTSTTPTVGTDIAANPAGFSVPQQKKVLTTSDFLQLLTTEMNNQDPLQPMDNTASMAQLAQFSSLDQMNTAFAELQPDARRPEQVHRRLVYRHAGDGNRLHQRHRFDHRYRVRRGHGTADTPQLEINGNYYPLTSVTKVELPSTTPAS
jgi:flagellar basal-body rod modification protein FlgD